MQLDVDDADVRLLLAVLEARLLTLSHEIHKAATREFKKQLEADEERVKALIGRLRVLAQNIEASR